MRVLLLVALLAPNLVLAQAPTKLGYQGRLLDASGTPVIEPTPVTFKIWPAATGGDVPLWREVQSLGLSDGYYATFLGDVTPLPADIFGGGELFLELEVGGTALTPRQRMASVPYAISCANARVAPLGRNLIDWQPNPAKWKNLSGTQASIALDTTDVLEGSASFRITVPLGTQGGNLVYGDPITVDPARRYRGRISAKMSQGSGTFYAGYVAYDATKKELTGNGGTWGYFLAAGVTLPGTWTTFAGTIAGTGASLTTFPAGTRFIRPLIIVNYGNAGITSVSSFEIYADETPGFAAFTGSLTNRDDFTGSTSTTPINLKYTAVQQNTSPSIIQLQANGAIIIGKAGFVSLDANADVVVKGGAYATMQIVLNGTDVISQTLAHSAGGKFWSQLHATMHRALNAGDKNRGEVHPRHCWRDGQRQQLEHHVADVARARVATAHAHSKAERTPLTSWGAWPA